MSFSYIGKPADGGVEEIRFHIQDTDEKSHLLENEEISYLITLYASGAINAICAAACEIMATRYARKQEISVANYNQSFDSVYKKLMDRAKRFRENSLTASYLVATGISVSEKDAQLSDTDNVRPSFGRGILDNPEAVHDPFSTSSDEDLS
jgi:hypothetical protein